MSMILVVEPDRSFANQLAGALQGAGWSTRLVGGRTQAIAVMAEQQPEIVIVDIAVPEAEELLAACAAGRGGPGSIAVVPAPLAGAVSADDYRADAIITKPFSDEQLERSIEACALLRKQRRSTAARGDAKSGHLSSQDIFGDILAEVESSVINQSGRRAVPEEGSSSVAGQPTPTARPSTSPLGEPQAAPVQATPIQATPIQATPIQAAPPKPAPAKQSAADDLEELLEQTLSGLLEQRPTRSRAKKVRAQEADDLDDLLDRTLGPLVQVKRSKPGAAPRSTVPKAPVERPPASLGATGGPATLSPPESPSVTLGTVPRVKPPEIPELDLAGLDNHGIGTIGQPLSTGASVQPGSEAGEVAPPSVPLVPVIEPRPPLDMPPTSAISAPIAFDAPDPYRTQMMPTLPAVTADSSQTLGDYTLVERIAVGGMAEVWKARRRGVEGFEKTVAIKRVLAHLTDSPELVSMLIDEAKLAARLSNPNIVQIYDLGKVEDDFFIAMEYVDGTDLRSALKAAREHDLPMPVGVAIMVTAHLARALDYAHRLKGDDQRELGLIHRDVSPQNILISNDGDIKLCDFGIAKAVTSAGHTQMGALKGKLQYMSPEQAWGKKLDARSDIFSLGSVLFEVLTGTKLFTGDSEIGVLDAVRDCRITMPRAIDPDIPEEAERIVLRALAKAPEDRYQSAGALAAELESVLTSLPHQLTRADLAAYLAQVSAAQAGGSGSEESHESTAKGAGSTSSAVDPSGTAEAAPTEEGAFSALAEDGAEARRGRWWLIAAIIALAVLGGVWLVIFGRSAPVSPDATSGSASSSPIPVAPATPAPSGTESDPAGSDQPSSADGTAAPPSGESTAAEITGTVPTGEIVAPAETEPPDVADGAGATTGTEAAPAAAVDLEKMVLEELARRTADIEAKMEAEYQREQQRLAAELAEAQARSSDASEAVPEEATETAEPPPETPSDGNGF